jgi:hypothetical protein
MIVTFNSIVYRVPLTHLKRTLCQIALQLTGLNMPIKTRYIGIMSLLQKHQIVNGAGTQRLEQL